MHCFPVRECNLLPEDSFDDYNLDDYLNDIETGLQKEYTEDISRFKILLKLMITVLMKSNAQFFAK